MKSCLYTGWIRHRRHAPTRHTFRYRVYMAYLDLDEIDTVFAGRWLWSSRRRAAVRFAREDYLGDPDVPLRTAVHDEVERQTGRRPCGPVRMLTNLRCFGFCFNPVTIYYCFAADGEEIDSVVAQITNTPWGERHCYVLRSGAASGTVRTTLSKAFHVSPFMAMDQEYAWNLTPPGRDLVAHMTNRERGRRVFDATLRLGRQELTGRNLAVTLVTHPAMTAKVFAAIYLQAALLRWKGTPFHPHPRKITGATGHGRP